MAQILRMTDPQLRIMGSKKRFRAVVAGRRFGKTHLAAVEMFVRAVNKPGANIWGLSPTYSMASDNVWPKLMEVIPQGYIQAKNVTDLMITLVNGSVIALKSADKPDRLRGTGLDFLVLDEAAFMDKSVWDTVRPNISDKLGAVLFISTPFGYNWFYDIVIRHMNDPDWDIFEYTTAQGGNVPQSEIDLAKSEMDERMFRQEYEASFESLAGRVYYAFDRKKNVMTCTDNGGVILMGLDFNINPMSAVFGVKSGGQIHVFHEYEIPSGNTEDMVRYVRAKFSGRHIKVFPDPTGNARKTSAPVGQTDFTILRRAGFQVCAPSHYYMVADKINTVNAALCNAKGERRLMIDGRCKSLCRGLDGLTYRPDSSEPDKSLGLDHITDALGYMVMWELPMHGAAIRNIKVLGV